MSEPTPEQIKEVIKTILSVKHNTKNGWSAKALANWHIFERTKDAERIRELEAKLEIAVEALEVLKSKSFNEPYDNGFIYRTADKALAKIKGENK